jgi:hypothetical protein
LLKIYSKKGGEKVLGVSWIFQDKMVVNQYKILGKEKKG